MPGMEGKSFSGNLFLLCVYVCVCVCVIKFSLCVECCGKGSVCGVGLIILRP